MSAEPVIGVLAGCGGAGASTFAAVLAACAGRPSFLLDCDPLGGGIDVLLGCEQSPGPRWGQVRLRGGPLDPEMLSTGLPRWHDVRFLAADSQQPLTESAVTAVLDAAAAVAPVVLDLPRAGSPMRQAALHRCDLVVLVTPAEVRGATAAAMLAPALDERCTSLVVRGGSRALSARQVSDLLGLPVLAELPYDPAGSHPDGLRVQRIRRRTRQAATSVWRACAQRRAEPLPPADGADAA
ncbi:MAG TPA: septum site-determining protein Ssd [Jatrophihabitans sp.]|nr:septum site-determining protein Ssd [Jatrophihabitans sp.]